MACFSIKDSFNSSGPKHCIIPEAIRRKDHLRNHGLVLLPIARVSFTVSCTFSNA